MMIRSIFSRQCSPGISQIISSSSSSSIRVEIIKTIGEGSTRIIHSRSGRIPLQLVQVKHKSTSSTSNTTTKTTTTTEVSTSSPSSPSSTSS